jgi:subtilisin-like proprotein convertase family protein
MRGGLAQPLRYASSPQSTIPDNNLAGIQDVIQVSGAGRVQDIRVALDIAHTWIGDLRVSLIAPDGTTVVLHDRSGANQDNIRRTYDTTTVPALASLRDRSVTGNWTLRVQDLAAQDVGTLKSWTLEITISAEPLVAEDSASIQIPDRDPTGVVRTLDLPTGRTVRDIAVSVDITHPWIGDLQVTLTPPGGTPIRLHDRTGGDADNLVRTWRSQDTPALQALRGRDAGGTWQLQAADLAMRDVGKLNRWKIEVVG